MTKYLRLLGAGLLLHILFATTLLIISTSVKSQPPSQQILVLKPLTTLQQHIDQSQIAEAHMILQALTSALKNPNQKLEISIEEWIELEFLRGRLAMAEGNFAAAIPVFENILSLYPDIARVRLELGMALFNLKQDQRARYQFDLALQATLPKLAEARVESVKEAMRRRRKWQVRMKLALVPDSNINAATDDRTVSVFGLPFVLNENATEQSGVGALAELGVTNAMHIGTNLTLDSSASVRRIEYAGSRFDDTIVSFYSGPRHATTTSAASLQFGGFRRWFGDGSFNRGIGTQLGTSQRIGQKWATGVNASLFWVDYDQISDRNGFSLQVEPYVVRAVGASGHVRAHFNYNHDFAREKNQASATYQYGVRFRRELPMDIRFGLSGSYGTRQFQAAQASFGVRRRDEFFSTGLDLAFRKLQILGAALEVSYRLEKADSNINLFSYSRHRFELGLTKEF